MTFIGFTGKLFHSLPRAFWLAALLASSASMQSQQRTHAREWWNEANDMMTPRGKYTDENKYARSTRQLMALDLMTSSWQNRRELDPLEHPKLLLRLVQALIARNRLAAAWQYLDEGSGLFTCKSPQSALSIYLCGERDRHQGEAAYFTHSFPGGRLDPSRPAPCRGLDSPPGALPACLDLARSALNRSIQAFSSLQGLVNVKTAPDSSLASVGFILGADNAASLKKKLTQRENASRLNLALVLQESGEPRELLKELDSETKLPACEMGKGPDPYVCLHIARGYRDLGDPRSLEVAGRALATPLAALKDPVVYWRANLVASTIEIRKHQPRAAAKILEDAYPFREEQERNNLEPASPLDLEPLLAGDHNSDDILVSAALQFHNDKHWQALLRRYVALVSGAGDHFLRRRFSSWRAPGNEQFFHAIATSVSSDTSQWINGDFAADRRSRAFQEFEKNAPKRAGDAVGNRNGAALWHAAWAALNHANGELLVVTQHRPTDFFKIQAKAVSPSEYTVLYYRSEEGPPLVHPLSPGTLWDEKIRRLRQRIEAGNESYRDLASEISKAIGVPAPQGSRVRRIAILAGGEFQQFPWALLDDANSKPLLQGYSPIQVSSLDELSQWNSSGPSHKDASFLANPDLQGLAPTIANGPLQPLVALLRWEQEDSAAAEKERRSLSAFIKPTEMNVLTGPAASEAALKNNRPTTLLHIRTHGRYLAGEVQVPASDRSVLLLNPGSGEDGLFLATEAQMLRLEPTRLVVLAVCQSSQGRSQRAEPVEGFRRSFHLAGARSVLAPLWSVNSSATAELIAGFYSRSRLPLDMALREAQLSFHYKNPEHWAGWIVSGDPFSLR